MSSLLSQPDAPPLTRPVPRVLFRPVARHHLWGYVFLAPMLLLLLTFKLVPMVQAFRLSLTSYDLLTPPRFVGFDNYVGLMSDGRFIKSVGVTLYYTFGTCIPIWFLSLGLALVFNMALPAKNYLRLAYFLPTIVPIVVFGMIWKFLFHPYGLLNVGIEQLGLPPVDWLTSSAAVIPGFILSSEWRFAPYFMVVYLAGLQNIPQELKEAASIDGANARQRFWYIVLPLLWPAVLTLALFVWRETWDAFVWPLLITSQDALRTVPIGLQRFSEENVTNYNEVMAMSFVAMLPLAILFFIFQRAFIQGIAGTGIKE
jgi:multiple sugar transport system permease protein